MVPMVCQLGASHWVVRRTPCYESVVSAAMWSFMSHPCDHFYLYDRIWGAIFSFKSHPRGRFNLYDRTWEYMLYTNVVYLIYRTYGVYLLHPHIGYISYMGERATFAKTV